MGRICVSGGCLLLTLLLGCRGASEFKGPTLAKGPLPSSYTVQVTGVGKAPDGATSAGQARLMAEAAAEADAQRRLALALYGDSSGVLKGARRIKAVALEGGWSLVTIELDLPTREDYVIVLDRLDKMESPLTRLVRTKETPNTTEVIVPSH